MRCKNGNDWLRQRYHIYRLGPSKYSTHFTCTVVILSLYRSKRKPNVNVSVYNLKSPLSSADFTVYALVLELFLIQSHLLWGEFSICALCCSYSQSLQFSFLVPPGTHHCWVDRGGVIWEACPTPLHMTVSVVDVMCYHCVRVAVGPHCHVCSTRRQA